MPPETWTEPETIFDRTSAGRRGSDQSALAQRVRDAGLLERTRGRYVVKLGVDGVLLVLVASAVAVVGDSWMQLLMAVAAAVVFGQFGFATHDAGHSPDPSESAEQPSSGQRQW